jgi:hypothetical protein
VVCAQFSLILNIECLIIDIPGTYNIWFVFLYFAFLHMKQLQLQVEKKEKEKSGT